MVLSAFIRDATVGVHRQLVPMAVRIGMVGCKMSMVDRKRILSATKAIGVSRPVSTPRTRIAWYSYECTLESVWLLAVEKEDQTESGGLESTDRSFQGAYNLKEGYIGRGTTERAAYRFGKLQKIIDLTLHDAISEDKISRQLRKLWSGTGEIPRKAATMLPPTSCIATNAKRKRERLHGELLTSSQGIISLS
ncbi:uncharacterized protein BT62DRAFT_923893 [Guyanagaster necrorhizus]|uniref:Uncharacterized protein n=1 Tax=Guyanagaster necrorhizus TaxID=856835 RepID=A0A9P7VHZ3_9AGAR|nr:uncharacterized protein BT62DRAFT_923893 [Guyanagaster necrorhizus MCA 3950]KAG7440715.1 hypothetical protein BT62DRAFT_923893 [Guyanagaster necrorhizus MCA 3950]